MRPQHWRVPRRCSNNSTVILRHEGATKSPRASKDGQRSQPPFEARHSPSKTGVNALMAGHLRV
jgi:hypothetical protein